MSEDQHNSIPDLEQYYDFMMRHFYAPFQHIQTNAAPDEMARLYDRIRRTWQALGETEPHWSVITSDQFRQGALESQMDYFLAMGRENVGRVEAAIARVGADFSTVKTVIDFGCGVGRVSAAYSGRGCHVTSVDISAAHLREAQAYFDRAELSNADFVQLTQIADIDALPQVDLVYSLIVLQHNPPPMIAAILRKLLGRVRDGGFTYFQLPTYKDGYRYYVEEDLGRPADGMEMHVLPQSAVFQLLKEEGFCVLEVIEDASCWDPIFRSQVFVAQKALHPPTVERTTMPAPEQPLGAPKKRGFLSRLNARRKAARRRNR